MGKRWKVYTAGRMSGIQYLDQINWRIDIQNAIMERTEENVEFIHPPYFYNYDEQNHRSDAEILEWEMSQLNDCDIVIVNLDGIESSIGTHMELGAVQGINRFSGKHIYVVGIGSPSQELHPWIREACIRIEADMDNAAEYIAKYLLV